MYEITLFITAILIGLMGSGHCLGMCGGIAGAHSFSATDAATQRDEGLIASTNPAAVQSPSMGPALWQILTVFNLGRISSYALIGFLAGILGSAIALNVTALILLRTLAAVMLILMGLYVGQWWSGLVRVERLGAGLWRVLSPKAERLRQKKGLLAQFTLGMIWGWLPCGLVYSALTWSMTSADPKMAALLMAGFGLGTLPSMLAAGLFAYHLRRWFSRLPVRRTFAVGLIVFGLWSLPVSWTKLFSEQPDDHMHHQVMQNQSP